MDFAWDPIFSGRPAVVHLCPDDLPENNFFSLLEAISQKRSYRLIYKLLDKYDQIFSLEAACSLLRCALNSELTLRAFKAILKRCPPVSELLTVRQSCDFPLFVCGLLEQTAYMDRADVLALLLEEGASPNRRPGFDHSPLECALMNQSQKSVELLMRQPDLDLTWTPALLELWARRGSPLQDFCLQAMAPRFLGWDPASLQPPPIPEAMRAEYPAQAGNWPLVERFCRERGRLDAEEGGAALRWFARMDTAVPEEEAAVSALNALLESCPELLRRREARRTLARFFLSVDEKTREVLRPWMERIRHRRVDMEERDWSGSGYSGLLNLWQALLPQGPTLAVDRWSDVFRVPYAVGGHEERYIRLPWEDLECILDACPILGKGRRGYLSPVAATVLRCGSPALVERVFQPGGPLADEDPDCLLLCAQDDEYPRVNRNALLTVIRKEEQYEL